MKIIEKHLLLNYKRENWDIKIDNFYRYKQLTIYLRNHNYEQKILLIRSFVYSNIFFFRTINDTRIENYGIIDQNEIESLIKSCFNNKKRFITKYLLLDSNGLKKDKNMFIIDEGEILYCNEFYMNLNIIDENVNANDIYIIECLELLYKLPNTNQIINKYLEIISDNKKINNIIMKKNNFNIDIIETGNDYMKFKLLLTDEQITTLIKKYKKVHPKSIYELLNINNYINDKIYIAMF